MASSVDLVIRVIADTKKAASDIEAAGNSVSGFSSGIKKAAVPAGIALAALAAAGASAANAAADDAQAAAILATNLKNTTGATQSQIDATEAYIDKMAKATGVADDQLRPAMANLARGSGDVTQAQKDLATALDVAVATGGDVESVTKAISKAYGGSTTSLKKLVPSLDDATLASGDMSAIMDELADKTGGSAAAAADTAAGKMQRMQVSMQEAQEEIGSALLPVLSTLATIIAKVAGAAQAHPTVFLAIAAAIGVLAAAIIVLNVALSVMAIAEAVALGPILLIVAAVIALIVVVVLIVKHFDDLKAAAFAVWGAIQTAFSAVVNWVKSAAQAVANAFVAAWDAIKSGAQAVANFAVNAFNMIKGAAESVIGWIKGNWPLLLAILTGPIGIAVALIVKNWDKIRDAAEAVWTAIKNGWNAAIDGIKASVSGLGAILSAPFSAMQSAIQWVIDKVNALISALGRIHVPHIDLPGPLGALTRTAMAPATAGPSVTGLAAPRVAGIGARGVSQGVTPTIIVNGALDPEAVARQIRRILAGHDRRMGLTA